MKRAYILILLLVLCCATVSAALTDLSGAPNVRILTDEVSPEPVEPVQDVTVKIRIYNRGGAIAKDVNVELDARYPFYLKTESQDFKEYEDGHYVACWLFEDEQ